MNRYLTKVLFLPLAILSLIFGLLQISLVQNKLINAFLPENTKISIQDLSGFFPFRFSIKMVNFETDDLKVSVENLSSELSGRLVSFKQIEAGKIDVKTFGSSGFKVSNLGILLPLLTQKLAKNITIKELNFNQKSFQDIVFRYDKHSKERSLKTKCDYGNFDLSWSLNKSDISAILKANKNVINCGYNVKNHQIALAANVDNKKLEFEGILEKDGLNGELALPFRNLKLNTKIYVKDSNLEAEIRNDSLKFSSHVSYDFNNQLVHIKGAVIDDIITIKPFTISDFSEVSDVVVLFSKGQIFMSKINLSRENFSLGNINFSDIDISQIKGINCSGILNGTGTYDGDHETLDLTISDAKYAFFKLTKINIRAKYFKDKIIGDLIFSLFKKDHSIGFKIDIADWLPNENSKIKITSQDIIKFPNLKLPQKQVMSGNISYKFDISGKFSQPILTGNVALKNGSYVNPIYGIYARDIALNSEMNKDGIVIKSLYIRDDTKEGGTIKGTGEISLKKKSDFANIKLKIDNFKALDQNWLKGNLFGNIDIKGTTFETLNVTGNLYSIDPTVDVSGLIQLSSKNIDIFESNPSQNKPNRDMSDNIKIPLNLVFETRPNLKIIGLGIDSIWSGNAKITGDVFNPKYEAIAKLTKGKIRVIDHAFELKNGEISADNSKMKIEVSAEKKVDKVMVGVKFKQRKNNSNIQFYSSPYLSDRDIMSYILFDKPTSEISAGEALTLFSVVNQLSGNASFDMLGKMKTLFGLDSISIKKNTDHLTKQEYDALSIGKKLGKLKISVDQGSAKDTTGVIVEADIAKNTKMSVDLSGRNAMSTGILWGKRY